MAVEQTPEPADAINKWVENWALRADAAAPALAALVAGSFETAASFWNDVPIASGVCAAGHVN
ncbi:hypothetical protein EU803_15100 [Loktanella sp. IMCC34160]|uniref:hypothetical protein n=1 Tax=Loktanella sp. IMCC34160 TaxID=2510646 RepID=UPI00101D193B|nr:hypothetical protein [Loktanella sp. IMCC34160]RYG89945.1 hypothetical protein EU803_15100 [Loktanella sp. IMCC34160]